MTPHTPKSLTPCSALRADGLLLRPFTAADGPAVARALRDPDILRWAVGTAVAEVPEGEERARRWLAARGDGAATARLAVTGTADGRPPGTLLGAINLRDINRIPGQAVVSYWVAPEVRGQGVAPRALDAAARWAFTPSREGGLGLHRLTLDHALVNPSSCRVAAKAGFRLEGTMRESFLDRTTGRRHDSHLHARLATDA